MTLVWNLGVLLFGLVILIAGAEGLIRGAVRIARQFGASPYMIGLTLVGFGTSAPELVVNISAAWRGAPGLAMGNVIGANVANIGLILGVAALLKPLHAHMRLLKVEVPLVIAGSILVLILSQDYWLGRLDGLILLAGFVSVAIYIFRSAKQESSEVKAEVGHLVAEKASPPWAAVLLFVFGVAGLLAGAHLMVESAVAIAHRFGVADSLIGVTIIAVGTTSPELASTIAAARRGEADIAVGNVVGSNLFNIFLILGVTSAICPLEIEPSLVRYELPIMVGFSVALLAVLVNGMKVHRWEGLLLILGYLGFLGWQTARVVG